jgi:hypothetical protein
VNIIDPLQERSDLIPPRQWLEFFSEPGSCGSGQIVYRQSLPLVEVDRKVTSYGGTICEGICFEHSLNRGYFAILALIINTVAFIVGVVYSVWKRDISAGFTLAGIMAVPISTLSLLLALWKV